jgi:two-component system, NarL family, response regulator LiaR
MKRHALIFGLVGGLLIATLQYTEYRFVVIEHSVELYGALVAILFAAFGIWLGLRITRSRETIRETVVVREVLVPAEAPALEPFAPNTAQQQTLGITARELEVLALIARGFSNREIAAQLFVSENTVKTHCARAFDKLGAARRTQAESTISAPFLQNHSKGSGHGPVLRGARLAGRAEDGESGSHVLRALVEEEISGRGVVIDAVAPFEKIESDQGVQEVAGGTRVQEKASAQVG